MTAAAAAGCICNSERGACSSPHPVRTGWMDGWGCPRLEMEVDRAGLWGGIYRASRRLGRRSLFRLRPPSLSSTAPPPLWFSFSFLFFLLDPNKKKFHNNSTRNRRPFSTRSHSFPFYYYFIIPKVTALGAREQQQQLSTWWVDFGFGCNIQNWGKGGDNSAIAKFARPFRFPRHHSNLFVWWHCGNLFTCIYGCNFLVGYAKKKNMDVARSKRNQEKKKKKQQPAGMQQWYVICHGDWNPPSPAARPCLIF